MQDLITRARLVDASEVEAHGITATVPRSEVEDALVGDEGPGDLILDVKRFGDGDAEASRRIAVEWERDDLERLLRQAEGDAITFAFDRTALQQALDEPDVEGHGLREKALVLTVAAATAAGAAGAAQAVPDAEGVGWSSSGAAAYTAIESARASEAAAEGVQTGYAGIESARASEAAAEGGPAAYSGIESARAAEAASDSGPAAYSGIESARASEAVGEGGIPSGYGDAVADFRAAEAAGDSLAAAQYGGMEEAGAQAMAETESQYGMPRATPSDYEASRDYGTPRPTAADYQATGGEFGAPRAMPADYEPTGDTGGGLTVDAPSPGTAATLAGAAALAITGAAFAARSRRRLTPSS